MNGRAFVAIAMLVSILAALLSACSKPAQSSPPASQVASPGQPQAVSDLKRTESSGSVTFVVTPDPAPAPGVQGLTFDIVMDTHSVDLDGYDLKLRATLRDGQGRVFQPTLWDAPPGGHHREGKLAFSGQPLVQADSRNVELVIRDVAGTKERIFRWDVKP